MDEQTEITKVQTAPPRTNGHAKEPESANPYRLTDAERQALHILSAEISNAKMVVYNLQTQLEGAIGEVKIAEARWIGALRMLANQHGMENAALSPDFSKLTRT